MKKSKTKFTFILDSNMIKKAIKILLVFLLFIYLSSCASFRSAEGLNGGEVSIAYIAPAAGAVRVGITNNLEARASFVGKALRSDLFVHTKNDSGKFNFGFTLGLQFVSDPKPSYYTAFTISNRNGRAYPYLSFFYFEKHNRNPKHEVNIGCEIIVYKNETSKQEIIITPELSFLIPPIQSTLIKTPIYGGIGIGYTFNFLKLLN